MNVYLIPITDLSYGNEILCNWRFACPCNFLKNCYCYCNSHLFLRNVKWLVQPLGKQLAVSCKAKCSLTIWPRNYILRYLPKWTENFCPHKNLCMNVCSTVFIISKSCVQLRWPSVDKWINKPWCIHTMEYYSVMKRNELLSHRMTWRKLKCILPSERSQSEKATSCIIPIIWHFGKAKPYR